MKILLDDLYQPTKEIYHLNLVAGKSGLNKSVNWIYLAEDIEYGNFLRGNELIITTGITATTKSNWLYKLIEMLVSKKSCGLIVNTGNYLHPSDITPQIKDYCNKHNFALFTMPWNIHIADVMQDFCNKIFLNTYHENSIAKIFQNIIFHPETLENQLETLHENGFHAHSSYTVAHISSPNSPILLQEFLDSKKFRYIIFTKDNYYNIVFCDCSEALTDAIQEYYEAIVSSTDRLPCIGIGESVSSIKNLHYAYKTALFAFQTAQTNQIKYCFYSKLGIYRLLLSVQNNELLFHMYKEVLEQLQSFDKANHTELTDTLELYIKFNGSIQETAAAMFTHRNTINYRMNKIRTLIPYDLNNNDDRFLIQLAFYIKHLLYDK